jgi:hypothetical protein
MRHLLLAPLAAALALAALVPAQAEPQLLVAAKTEGPITFQRPLGFGYPFFAQRQVEAALLIVRNGLNLKIGFKWSDAAPIDDFGVPIPGGPVSFEHQSENAISRFEWNRLLSGQVAYTNSIITVKSPGSSNMPARLSINFGGIYGTPVNLIGLTVIRPAPLPPYRAWGWVGTNNYDGVHPWSWTPTGASVIGDLPLPPIFAFDN